MYKKVIALVMLLVISCVIITGCKKKGEAAFEPRTPEEITSENLDTEMDRLEKEIAEDERRERSEGL